MASIVLNGDTSGSVTLSPPAVAGTNTATLPAATGTVMVSGNMPAFSAYATSDLTVSSGTITKATLDVEEFDTNSNFASSRFTPTVAGYYQINAGITLVATGGMTNQNVYIYKNGSQYKLVYYRATPSDLLATVSTVVYCNGTTDYIELYGRIAGSASIYFGSNGTSGTWMNGCLIRAA